jgi:hypothetical protein
MSDTLTVRIGQELAEALRHEAQATGRTRGEIVRLALEERLRRKSGLRVIRKYFGVVEGPADLSTNRAHRRQWGRKPR